MQNITITAIKKAIRATGGDLTKNRGTLAGQPCWTAEWANGRTKVATRGDLTALWFAGELV